MSSPLTDSTIANGDVIEAVHITQMFSILADLEDGQAFFRDDVGSANAYQVNFNGSPSNKNQFTAYKKGMLVVFKAANANTGASTLQVVGPSGALSAIPLTKGGNALIAGEIVANQMLLAVYNDAAGGRFDLVGVAGASNLDGLSDVAISSPTSGQVVRHNGSNFVNANLTASDMPTGIDAARIGGGAVSNTEFGYLDGVTSAIQTQLDALNLGKVPVGCVAPFAGSSAPTGWLLCYGQNVSRATYSALFSAIGTTYGSGDGSTTFTLPDLRGRGVAGKDNMGGTAANRLTNSGTGNPGINGATLGGSGGADRHQLTSSQIPNHNHNFPINATGGGGGLVIQANYNNYQVATVYTSSVGSDQAHPNCQPTLVLNYIIYAGV